MSLRSAASVPDRIDLLIRGAVVYDGTGSEGTQADVGVARGRIVFVGGASAGVRADVMLDAGGLALGPGFIDLHSHADFTLPAFPSAENSVTQGVTTEVQGNCGFSPAPLSEFPEREAGHREACRGLGPDLDWEWQSFAEYLDRLDATRPAVNCVPLVGHGALRTASVGMTDRAPTAAEAAAMATALGEAVAAGAWGMSTGLVYPPGAFAATSEIASLLRTALPRPGLYASHIRNEGAGLLAAVAEALEIGAAAGVPVHVSHLKAAGLRNHGSVSGAIELLESARRRGRTVTCDAYPYTAGSTMLSQVLPPWTHDGGPDALVARLRSDEVRARIRHEIETGLPGWSNYVDATGGWSNITIASVGDRTIAGLEGRTVAETAAAERVDPLIFVLDLLVRDRAAPMMILELMAESDVEAVLRHPYTAIGSDQLGVTGPGASVHPRCYGTFARVLGVYVRERHVLELPDAIRRMTGLAAAILGLVDRGRVAVGCVADLVLFDPATVSDCATYAAPAARATGIEAVLIGGRFAVRDGRPSDLHLGRVLRRGDTAGRAA